MLPEIITFNKTMQYRIEEYEQLFDVLETPCSEITEIWGSIFEDLAIIGVGWQALWVLSERNCKKHNLVYPTAVIVHVHYFSWYELKATVTVVAVQEDIVLPSTLEVPVIELHPIKTQNYDETDLRDIEDWLDKCRYFFTNLWYPWDAKISVTMMDWCESHLRNRLKMHYDLKNGVFDKAIENYLKLLLAEAQNVSAVSEKNFSGEDDRLSVVKKYIRKKIIKTELDLFEEPDLRHGMIILKSEEKQLRNPLDSSNSQEVKIVWISGNCQSLMHHLESTQSVINQDANVKVFGSLQEALDSSCTNDIIILPPAVHNVSSLRGIENGGVIRGLEQQKSVIMPDTSTVPKAILLECFGFIELENLTISKPSGIAIQVFKGAMKLRKCKIISTENDSTSRGIVVVSKCKLFLEECELQGFGTAIALHADTYASVVDTKISDSYEGIKAIENATLLLQNTVISSCSLYGIRIESSELNSDVPLTGDLDLLEGNGFISNINAKNVTFHDNKKGNVIVKQRFLLNFDEQTNANVSDVICISDEEDPKNSSVEEIQISFNKALKGNGLAKYEMLKKGTNPDYSDVAYREAVSRLRYLLNESYVPTSSKYPTESDEESGLSFVVTDRTRTARLSPYKRPLFPQRFQNKVQKTGLGARSFGDDSGDVNVPTGSRELMSFIEKQEEYIDQLEKEAQYCRDELSQLLGKVKELISENESLQEQQKSGLMKVMFEGMDEERLGDHQNPERYRKRLEGPLIVYESRISELEAQLTQTKIDLRKAQEEAEMYKKKLEDCQPSSSNYDFYKQIENLQREKRDLNESLAKLQASINQIREKEMDASKKVQRTLDVVDKTQLEKQQAEMEVYRLKNELELQHDKLLEVLSEQTRKVADERNQAERRYLQHVERLNTELTIQRDAFSKLQMEVEKHLRIEEDLKRDLAAKNMTIENVKKELNNKISTLQAELSAALSDRDSLEQELNTSRMSNERTERLNKQECNRLQVEISALRQRLDRSDAELIHSRRENLRLLEQISTLEKELTLYKIKLGEKKDPIEEEEEQAKEKLLNSRISEIEARHVKTVSDLEGLIENQSQVMAQLKAECQSLTQKLEESAARHKEEMEKLQSKLNSLDNKMEAKIITKQWTSGDVAKDPETSSDQIQYKKILEETKLDTGGENETYSQGYTDEVSQRTTTTVLEEPYDKNYRNSFNQNSNQQSFSTVKSNILDSTFGSSLQYGDSYETSRDDFKKEDQNVPFNGQGDFPNYGIMQSPSSYSEEKPVHQQDYQEPSFYQEQTSNYQEQTSTFQEQQPSFTEPNYQEQSSFNESKYQEQQGPQEQFFYQEPTFKEQAPTEEPFQGLTEQPAFLPLTDPPAAAQPEPKLPTEAPKSNSSQRFQRAAELSRQSSKSEDTPRGKLASQTRTRTAQSSRNQQKAPPSRFK